MSLKLAAACSALLHMGILAMRPPPGILPPTGEPPSLEVTYEAVPVAPQKPPARPAPSKALPATAPRVERPALPSAPVPQPDPAPARLPPRPVAVEPPPAAARPLPSAEVVSATVMLPVEEFAEVEHKERVREHLRSFLLHPSLPTEGTVRIRLLLGSQGVLQQAAVLESSDHHLQEAALRDAQRAAPYPPFPRPMKKARADYEFLVRYAPE